MATGEQWAQGLQGAGAWFSGQGPQYEAAKVAQQRTDMQDQLLRDEARQKAMVTDFSRVYAFMNAGKPELAVQLLQNRIPEIQRLYGDPKDSIALLEAVSDPARHDEAKIELEGFLGAAGALPGGGGAKRTDVFKNGAVLQATSDGSINLTLPSGQKIAPADPMWQQAISEATGSGVQYAGDEAAARAYATQGAVLSYAAPIAGAQAGAKAEVEAATAPAIAASIEDAKAGSTRAQESITLGIDAAKSIPIFKRAEKLLQTVETGGFDKVKVDAKKWFGIESANEAEFSNLLGKQVIAQIKPTFGAAPTVKEGEWLRAMESGWGTSTEGNKRLIANGLRLAERRAETGQQRALERKDKGSFDEIESYRKFTFDGPAGAQRTGGKLMQDAQGNRAIVYPDGTVEPQ